MATSASRDQAAGETRGTVRWYDERRGFGYIIPDTGRQEGSEDVFLHESELLRSGLKPIPSGQRVRYRMINESGGRLAVDIHLDRHGQRNVARH